MLELILTALGVLLIALGIFYFENKKLWIALGAVLVAVSAYFLLFTASPSDAGNGGDGGLVPGTGPDPTKFVMPADVNELVLLRGTVINFRDCPPRNVCIELLDQEGKNINVVAGAGVNLNGVQSIDALGRFENSTFIAEEIIPTGMKGAMP